MILQGDCVEVMRGLESGSVQCCVTSPPYYGLRDYGIPPTIWPAVTYIPMVDLPPVTVPEWTGCLGLEPSPHMFVAHMVLVFREVRRVLKDDGALWLNLGDSYAGSWGNRSQNQSDSKNIHDGRFPETALAQMTKGSSYKPKDLMGMPWRVAFALQADGWFLRQDIIWSKPNPMPESVRDRCTKAHEYMFLLSKSRRYYYDAEAIKEPLAKASDLRLAQNIAAQKGSDRVPGKTNGPMKAVGHGGIFGGKKGSQVKYKPSDPNYRNGDEQWGRECLPSPDGRANKKSVWTVATTGYKEAHFATFPPELVRPCVLAGCPQGGTVIDPFGGSGTVGAVALEEVRDFVLIEIKPEYCRLSEKRLDQVEAYYQKMI